MNKPLIQFLWLKAKQRFDQQSLLNWAQEYQNEPVAIGVPMNQTHLHPYWPEVRLVRLAVAFFESHVHDKGFTMDDLSSDWSVIRSALEAAAGIPVEKLTDADCFALIGGNPYPYNGLSFRLRCGYPSYKKARDFLNNNDRRAVGEPPVNKSRIIKYRPEEIPL